MGIPSKAQVLRSFKESVHFGNDKEAVSFAKDTLKTNFSFDLPDTRLKKISSEFGFEYVSLLSEYRKLNYQEPPFYYLDSHWNKEGQLLAFKKITPALTSLLGEAKKQQ